jgi:hypothetical protein
VDAIRGLKDGTHAQDVDRSSARAVRGVSLTGYVPGNWSIDGAASRLLETSPITALRDHRN